MPGFNAKHPLVAVFADGRAGMLPAEKTGLALSRSGVLVPAFGQNPDGEGTLLRVWEQAGNSGDLTVTLPQASKFTTATPVNLRGEKLGESVAIANGKLTFSLKAYAPASFNLR
ncbi:MAG TPA: hypothetical protein VMW15_11930 [Terracidiphilus sp.]|nr:hypothetical protein [Terracidiphilus sp.]